VVLLVCVAWALVVWLAPLPAVAAWVAPSLLWHKVASVTLGAVMAIHLFLMVTFEEAGE
jgi:hypothetical protein